MVTNASVVISVKSQEFKKVVFELRNGNKTFTLVKNFIDGILNDEIVLNSEGWNITTPEIVKLANEIVELSK